MITQSQLQEVLYYDADTGIVRWRITRGKAKADSIADHPNVYRRGSRCVWLGGQAKNGGRFYPTHRLAWLYVHGCWPAGEIDHINGDAGDNRLSNLREATSSQNKMNSRRSSRNKSGIKGVSFDTTRGKWMAAIKAGSYRRNLGRFDTKEAAAEAYRVAALDLHRDFARVNELILPDSGG